jgi:hypothetical protein
VVAAVALVVIAVSNGNGGGLGGIVPGIGEDEPKTPAFAWDESKAAAVTTAVQADGADKAKGADEAAAPAAAAAAQVLDELYTQAFLVPQNWQEGTYEDAVAVFARQAQPRALKQIEVLTAGTAVGEVLDRIDPKVGTLKTTVLLDPDGRPYSVVGTVKFTARGKGETTNVTFASNGQYFLEKIDGRWRIVAFTVTRDDRKQPGGATASISPTEEAS